METKKKLTYSDISRLNMEEKLRLTDFFVEATSAERSFIWADYNWDNVNGKMINVIGGEDGGCIDKHGIEWIQDKVGFGKTLGNIGVGKKKPVTVDFTWYIINGKYVCFYQCMSRFCDWGMIENWIKKHFPVKYDNGRQSAMTDASNFHQCYNFCRE